MQRVDDEICKHIQSIFRFALRLTKADQHRAEDLTQETLLRAVRGWPKLKDPLRARTWLLQITANLWRDEYRKRKRAQELTGSPLPDQIPYEYKDVGQAMLLNEECASALTQLDRLPDRQRQVLYLHACEDLPIAQVANVLGISSTAAKASLCVARERMRRFHLAQEATVLQNGTTNNNEDR